MVAKYDIDFKKLIVPLYQNGEKLNLERNGQKQPGSSRFKLANRLPKAQLQSQEVEVSLVKN